MTCVHLKKLYQICQDNDLRLASSDLIRIVCKECNVQEICPSMLTDEYDQRHDEPAPSATPAAPAKPAVTKSAE